MNRSRVDWSTGGPHQNPVENADDPPARPPPGATTSAPTITARAKRIVQTRLASGDDPAIAQPSRRSSCSGRRAGRREALDQAVYQLGLEENVVCAGLLDGAV